MKCSLEWYRYFCTVAESGGITQASKELFVSQPAVSHSIRQLESALGCKLFERSPKGSRLTCEGEILYEYVKNAFDSIAQGEKKLLELTTLECGEIRIGASDMTLRFYLLPYLEKYHRLYPKIKIIVTNAPTPDTLRMLDGNKIDFGVVSEDTRPIPGSKKVRLIEDVFVCSEKYRTESVLTLEELAAMPMICLEKNTSTRKYIDSFFSRNDLTLSPEFELATSDLIVRFAVRGLGVGCVVRDFAAQALESGELFELKTKKPIPPRSICTVQSKHISAAGSRLLAMLE